MGQYQTNLLLDFDLTSLLLICHLTSHRELQVVLSHCNYYFISS